MVKFELKYFKLLPFFYILAYNFLNQIIIFQLTEIYKWCELYIRIFVFPKRKYIFSKHNSFWHKSKPQSSEQIKSSQSFKSRQLKTKNRVQHMEKRCWQCASINWKAWPIKYKLTGTYWTPPPPWYYTNMCRIAYT